MLAKGTPIHGEFTSADASALSEANSRLALYGAGSTTSLTLGSTDYVALTDLVISVGAALTVTIYSGADATVDAGEQMAKLTFAAAGVQSVRLDTPGWTLIGTYPKVKTSGAGTVTVFATGVATSIAPN
jgi:hypothetical protein